ncbi:MAG: AAA family ATPase [Spirochaetales bacterium]|nr:AAA family ATPase [Spirochaetales bacterium]
MRIIPIASGKGGVGKSLLAVNMSIALGQAGFSVVLVDLDLGASNAHTILGIRSVTTGIGHYLQNKDSDINDFIIDTEYSNLRLLPGEAEIPGLANIKFFEKRKILKDLKGIKADFVIIDLGAGTNMNTLDLFLASSEGVIVTTPSLTATLNAYLFLKNIVFRLISTSFGQKSPATAYLEHLQKDGNSLQRLYVPRLLEILKAKDPKGYEKFDKRFKVFCPRLVFNMIDDPKDSFKAQKLRVSCREYLGVDMEHLGVIYKDHLQDVALSSRLPIIVYKPQAVLSQAIFRISEKLVQLSPLSEEDFDYEAIEDSYQIANEEASNDFDLRIAEIKDLLNTGALTEGDLLETIRTQQFEINSLKKENMLIKRKLVKAVNSGYKL